MPLTGETLFVLADTRSGSTLVDNLLGAHPSVVSLGELHWLTAYVRQDRKLYNPVHPLTCSCGRAVPECPFWLQVAAALGRPLDTLQLRPNFFPWIGNNGRYGRTRLRQTPKYLVQRFPGSARFSLIRRLFGSHRLGEDSASLFDAIFEVTGSQYLVDSSKLPLRFRATYDVQPHRTRVLILARDYRAVTYSKMRRGRSLEGSAISWRRKMEQIEAVTACLPEVRKCKLKYEALCEDPERELTRVCDWLDLKFVPMMLLRPTQNVHHIGGSSSKFDPSRKAIRLDTSYRAAFSSEQLAKLRDLVGDVADTWGY